MSANSPSKITAQMVSLWRDDSLIGVALAEREDSSGWNLVFERSATFTDADRKGGEDTYCITNEAGVAIYGGVTGWAIAGGDLSLGFTEKAAGDLGLATDLSITLTFAPDSIKALGEALEHILAPKA
jgi:hypothetical protein